MSTATIRRTVTGAVNKFATGLVSDRQIRVIASDATPDRMEDVLEPAGCQLADYKRNPVVLAQHDAAQPIARCSSIEYTNGRIEATIDFPAAGVSETSDLYLRLMKAGVLSAVSVGFLPIAWTPIKGAGTRFTQWNLLELSVVSVPANPSALVTEKRIDYAAEAARIRLARARAKAAQLQQPARMPGAVDSEADRASRLRVHRLRGAVSDVDPRVLSAEAAFRLGSMRGF